MVKKLLALGVLIVLAALPLTSGGLLLGSEDGNVTLTNIDGSYYYFDNTNITAYSYLSYSAGYWNLNTAPTATEDYFVLALVVGVVALCIAVIALVWRMK